MNLDSIMSHLTSTTKVAQQTAPAAPAAPAAPTSKVAAAVEAAVNAAHVATEKTAETRQNPASPQGALEDLAMKLAAADQDMTVKAGHNVGRAIIDGMMAQWGAYEKVAAEAAKTASAQGLPEGITAEDIALVKMAQQDPAGFLKALQERTEGQDKEAEEAAYVEQYNDVVDRIFKGASAHYLAGYEVAQALTAQQ